MRLQIVLAIVCGVGEATAGVVDLDNGVAGTGKLIVSSDDFGAYGEELSPQNNDAYRPANTTASFGATSLAGAYVFVTTPDSKTSAVVLTNDSDWFRQVEPGASMADIDGLAGDHAGLARTVTLLNTATGSAAAHSAFTVGDPTAAPVWELTFDLTQTLTYDAPTATTEFLQTYVITNTGMTSQNVTFHAYWDASMIWDNGFERDIVGVGTGLCYVYIRDDGLANDQAVSLADGGSSIPFTSYYGGKVGILPDGLDPAYTSKDGTIFVNRGMPATWKRHVATIGYDTVGETDPTLAADPTMGLEWSFSLAMGARETIAVRRVYGTYTLLCPGGVNCGNGVMDGGELCDDGQDSATCNGISCTPAACGDGYLNAAAGEQCEPGGGGVDTVTCNANCQVAMCGDGYVNVAALEECEQGELCDLATCRYDFTLGGGCAGCATERPDLSWIALLGVFAFTCRRRRRDN